MKFSVIIPVFNKADTISASLDSVLSQTFDDCEIIVVNDGSKDNINDVMSAYPTVKMISQDNAGVSVARNTGILAANGDYICFLDADDLWLPCHLDELSRLIDLHCEINYFITSHRTLYPDGKYCDSSDSLSELDGDNVVCDNLFRLLNKYGDSIVHTNSICVKREALSAHGLLFEPGERIGEDTDMWYRIALKERLVLSKKVTNVYRREYSTATQNSSNTQDWIFARRRAAILSDAEVSEGVKNEYVKLIDRYIMACCRDLASVGHGSEARKKLKTVEDKKGKRYVLTYILCRLPKMLCRRILGRN